MVRITRPLQGSVHKQHWRAFQGGVKSLYTRPLQGNVHENANAVMPYSYAEDEGNACT
jgi:hypothetical protein